MYRLSKQWLLSLVLPLGCSSALNTPTENRHEREPISVVQSALFADPERTMVFVAHEDDDVSLLNPDSTRTIRAGHTFRSVVFTSGDAGFPCPDETGYIKGRESGELAAYAKMANVSFDPANPDAAWDNLPAQQFPTLPGKYYRVRTLLANPKVSIVYLGLSNNDEAALEHLWNDTTGTLSFNTYEPDNRRPQNSYTRAELLTALLWLMNDFHPVHINTLDSSKLWGTDYPLEHTDHVHSALFALSAAERYTLPHTLRTYRTYNPMVTEPENLSVNDTSFKLGLLQTYGEYDAWFPNAANNHCPSGFVTICGKTDVCQDPDLFWSGLEARQYTVAPVQGTGSVGGIIGPTGKCLQASGTSVGSTVSLATCNMATANQNFKLNADGTIRQKSSGLCVAANGASALARPRGIGLTLRTCPTTPISEQQFIVMTNGQFRGPDATCVAASGSALSIQECDDVSSQLGFAPQFSPAPFTAATTGYTDTEIPDDVSIYRSLRMADIDADNDADLCVRRSGGIYCSTYASGTFSAPTLKLAQFTNAAGYGAAQYGSTVQLADITNDKRADVCGRGPSGIYCATWSGTTLGGYSLRSTAFGSYGSDASYYGSIRFPDVNGDGFADVCGRNANGIECGLNNGAGQFNAPTQWIATEFTDALWWDDEDYGSTLQFADIDGDGKIDVCGRSADGIRCALHDTTASQFVEPHLTGASDDFDDATGWFTARSYYWSIGLADINGDGRADVCGRDGAGLRCGTSMGASFGLSQFMIPVNPYSDGGGWSPDRYGSTMLFGDLNGDKHADVCGHGPIPGGGVGIRCAFSP